MANDDGSLICRVCLQSKPLSEFAFKIKAMGTRHKRCRDCVKAYSAKHYRENAHDYKRRGKVNSAHRRMELHRRVFYYLAQHPCVDCGETDPLVLELDHRDPSAKAFNLSRMWGNGHSWEKIQQEIEKCDVRCANCHRRRTARQQDWLILAFTPP